MLVREERVLLGKMAKIISMLNYFFFGRTIKFVCEISGILNNLEWSFPDRL